MYSNSSYQTRLQQQLPEVVDDDEDDYEDDIVLADESELEDAEPSKEVDDASAKNHDAASTDMEDKETLLLARKFGQDSRAKRLAKKVEIEKNSHNQLSSQSMDMLESLKALKESSNMRIMDVAYRVFEGINRELDKAIAFGKENRSVTFGGETTSDRMTTLGLILGEKAGMQCTILDFVPGSPGYLNDKIRKGDIIRRVNDVEANAENIEALLRGNDVPGTTVGLLIERRSRKRPFDVNLTRAPVSFVQSKSQVHEKLQQLANAASLTGEEAPIESNSLLRDIRKQIDSIDREYMEKEHVLIGEIEYKIECLKAVQNKLFEFLMTFKDIDVNVSASEPLQLKDAGSTHQDIGGDSSWHEKSILQLQKELEQANSRTEHVVQLLSEATEELELLKAEKTSPESNAMTDEPNVDGKEAQIDGAPSSAELERLKEIIKERDANEASLRGELEALASRVKEEEKRQNSIENELGNCGGQVARLESDLVHIRSDCEIMRMIVSCLIRSDADAGLRCID